MYTDATHFAHRESSGYVIDLYWDPANAWHQFRVQVLERGSGNGFVLFPTTGRASSPSRVYSAIQCGLSIMDSQAAEHLIWSDNARLLVGLSTRYIDGYRASRTGFGTVR